MFESSAAAPLGCFQHLPEFEDQFVAFVSDVSSICILFLLFNFES